VKRQTFSLQIPQATLPLGQGPLTAVRAGELVFTAGIPGIDTATGEIPPEPQKQFALAFQNLRALLDKAGASDDAVGLITVFTPDRGGRAFINAPWLEMYPTESRPARKTNHAPLPEGLAVQVSAVAVPGGERTSLGIPGLSHKDPLPMGASVGRYVFSSVFAPEDPANGKLVDGALAQIRRVFDNGGLLMEQAGGSEDNINHYWVFMKDFKWQPAMVEHWVGRWPTFGDRPARKTVPYELPAGSEIQTQFTGVLGARRENFEVPGVGHHDPIPMGSRVGPLLQSSGIYGIDPATGKVVEGRDHQTDMVLRITKGLMEQAGGSADDIAALTVMLQDFRDVPYFRSRLKEFFPDEKNGPALHFINYEMPKQWHVQFHVTAVLD
jgi:enamine deaminase RidA (YjgF/YER057c/UK114 family)